MSKKEISWMELLKKRMTGTDGNKVGFKEASKEASKEWINIKAGTHPEYIQKIGKGVAINKTQSMSKVGTNKKSLRKKNKTTKEAIMVNDDAAEEEKITSLSIKGKSKSKSKSKGKSKSKSKSISSRKSSGNKTSSHRSHSMKKNKNPNSGLNVSLRLAMMKSKTCANCKNCVNQIIETLNMSGGCGCGPM